MLITSKRKKNVKSSETTWVHRAALISRFCSPHSTLTRRHRIARRGTALRHVDTDSTLDLDLDLDSESGPIRSPVVVVAGVRIAVRVAELVRIRVWIWMRVRMGVREEVWVGVWVQIRVHTLVVRSPCLNANPHPSPSLNPGQHQLTS